MKERELSQENAASTRDAKSESTPPRKEDVSSESARQGDASRSSETNLRATSPSDEASREKKKSRDAAVPGAARLVAKAQNTNATTSPTRNDDVANPSASTSTAARVLALEKHETAVHDTRKNAEKSPIGDLRLNKRKAKSSDDEIVPIHDWIYWTMTALFRVFFKIGGWRLHGRRNVPKRGAVILAPNHVSLFDPPLVGCASPRRVTTMGKAELFDKKWFGVKVFPYIIQHMATFPVKRGAPDRRAIRRAQKVLRDGEALVVFPEGTRTRSGELGEGSIGLAMIAHSTKAPIVPMFLKGTDAALSPLAAKQSVRFFRTEVYFGAPLFFEEEYARKADRETLQIISNRVMQEIQVLKARAESR